MSKKNKSPKAPKTDAPKTDDVALKELPTAVEFRGDDAHLRAAHGKLVAALADVAATKGVTPRVVAIIRANVQRCANQIARAGNATRSPERKALDKLVKQIEAAKAAGVDVSALLSSKS
jgi:hypothetical protein